MNRIPIKQVLMVIFILTIVTIIPTSSSPPITSQYDQYTHLPVSENLNQASVISQINDTDALIYTVKSFSDSAGRFEFETFDPLLNTQISGFKGMTSTTSNTSGTLILRTKSHNSTHRTIEANHDTRMTQTSITEGKEFSRSLFGSSWKDVDEEEIQTNSQNSTNYWIGSAENSTWLDVLDHVEATLYQYTMPSNATGNEEFEFELTGLNAALNISDYHWEVDHNVISVPDHLNKFTSNPQVEYFRFHNDSSRIYVDQTDDIFDNEPYNITRYVQIDVIRDQSSGLYLQSFTDILFHIDFVADGKIEDSGVGSLVDADILVDLTAWSNETITLHEYFIPPVDDQQAPKITEMWMHSFPKSPTWVVHDDGFFNISLFIDGTIVKSQVFLNEGSMSIVLQNRSWLNLTIFALDAYNNSDALSYINRFPPRDPPLPILYQLIGGIILLLFLVSILRIRIPRPQTL